MGGMIPHTVVSYLGYELFHWPKGNPLGQATYLDFGRDVHSRMGHMWTRNQFLARETSDRQLMKMNFTGQGSNVSILISYTPH